MNRRRLAAGGGVALALAGLAIWWSARGDRAEDAGSSPSASAARTTAPRGAAGLRADRIDVATVARGSIEGTVRDPGGVPVAAAEVCGRAQSDDLSADDQRDPLCVATGPDGRYRLTGLLPATYWISASADGFAPGEYLDQKRRGSLRLAAGEARRGVDITLAAGGVELTGVVKDIGGGPVDGAWVHAQRDMGWGGGWGAASHARSKADGSFRMWVAPGAVHLSADADGYSPGQRSASAPGQTVEILLTPESVLAGRVVEVGTGAPVPGAQVSSRGDGPAWDMDEGGSVTTLSDAEGRFRLTRLPPGRYKPSATAPAGYGQARESALLGVGQSVDGIVIEVHPAALVTGRVVVAGGDTPCEEGWVRLSDAKAGRQRGGGVEREGKVEIEAVLPGTYRVEVGCDGFRSPEDIPDLVVVAGRSPDEQRWTVRPGARIRGTVRSSDGAPVAQAQVRSQPAAADPKGVRAWRGANSAADGTFELAGLDPGTYKIAVEPMDQPAPPDPVEVTVAEGGEATVDIVLDQGGGVAGEVVDERGTPIAGVMVHAESAHRWSWGPGGRTHSRDDGSFSLTGLRPGTYRIVAQRQDSWAARMRAPGKSDDDRIGEKVAVVAGKSARVRLVVESLSGVIRGRVVDGGGRPITDAFVDSVRESDSAAAAAGNARRQIRWSWSRKPILTDTDGGFVLDELSPGKYTVRAYRRGGGESLAEGVAVDSTVTLTIRQTASVAGRVETPGGVPPEQLTVELADRQTGFQRSESFFLTGGEFAIRDLPAGSFAISVSSADGNGTADVQLSEGQNLTGLAIRLAARATVTGRVVSLDEGKPLPGFHIQVMPAQGGSGLRIMLDGNTPVSGADGRFVVENAPAGRVHIMAVPLDFEGSRYGFARRPAQLDGGRTIDVGDLRAPPARLRGNERGGDLGFTLKQNPPDTEPGKETLVVAVIRPDGPAAKSGLQIHDEIVSVDGHDVRGDMMAYWSLVRVPTGTTVTLGLARGASVRITAVEPP